MTADPNIIDGYDFSGGAPDSTIIARSKPEPLPLLPVLGHEVPLYRTDGLSYSTWLAYRRAGRKIGASHVAGIMQRHPFATPLSVAAEIKGLSDTAFGEEELFRMELGRVCEAQIRRIAAVSLDAAIVAPGSPVTRNVTTWPQVLQHPRLDMLTCNLDGVFHLDGERMPLECKWTSWRNRAAWRALADTRDLGECIGTSVFAYYMQVQTQLAVTGLARGILIGIVGEDAACRMLMNIVQGRDGDETFDPKPFDVVVVTVERDEAMIADIEKVVPRFYRQFVAGEKLPPVTNPSKDLPTLRDAFRALNPQPAPPEIPKLADLCRRYRSIVQELSKGEKLRDQRKAELMHTLTERGLEGFTTPGFNVSYKKRVDGVRVFRVSESRGE